MKCYSPALSLLISSEELLHSKRQGFQESILEVHQHLAREQVIREQMYLENHSVHTFHNYAVSHFILNGVNTGPL